MAAVIATACIVIGQWSQIRHAEDLAFDYRAKLTASSRPPDPSIVVVTVDDRSLELLEPLVGRWPWPRAILASLIDYCSAADAIGVDLIMAESDRLFAGSDDLLAETVSNHGRVVVAMHMTNDEASGAQAQESAALPGAINTATAGTIPDYSRVLLPYSGLVEASRGVGCATQRRDEDGVLRRYDLAATHNNVLYPSLALAIAAASPQPDNGALAVDGSQQGSWQVGDRSLTVDDTSAFYLAPLNGRHQVVSAADVLTNWQTENEGGKPELSRDFFKDKLVVIGATATGLGDLEVTADAAAVHGVFVNAAALDNLRSGQVLRRAGTMWTILLSILLAGLLACGPIHRPQRAALYTAILLVCYSAVAVAAALQMQLMLPVIVPSMTLLALGSVTGTLYWRYERRMRQHLQDLEAAKQRYTDMLVHDLKNRVSPISISMEVMLENLSDGHSDGLERQARTAQFAATRLLAELKSLLDIRKMSDGRMELACLPVNVSDFLNAIADAFEGVTTRYATALQVTCSDDQLTAEIDRDVMERVMGNLLWNAYEKGDTSAAVTMSAERHDAMLELRVANAGPTIPKEVVSAVFDDYFSWGGKDGHEGLSGTGLGLAFCKMAVAAHSGTIEIISPRPDYSDGAEVLVRLPVRVAAANTT
jgi:CHASE2 domain-containing sensor protein